MIEKEKEVENPLARLGVFKNELSVDNTNIVSNVSAAYLSEIRKRQRVVESQLEAAKKTLDKATQKFNETVSTSGKATYNEFLKELVEHLKALGLKVSQDKVFVTADYYENKGGETGAFVKSFIKISWEGGEFEHSLQRKPSKEEKELLSCSKKTQDKIDELERYLMMLRARRGEVVELANDAMGAVARRSLEKADPTLVKQLDSLIQQDVYRLPELPSAL